MIHQLDDEDLRAISERAAIMDHNTSAIEQWEVQSLVAEVLRLRGQPAQWPGDDDASRGDRGPWIQTFTGRRFHPLSPQTTDIVIEDIAHALSMICRYAGHTRKFYSVAEHSVIVSLHVPPEYAREALLHDASEAYIGDVSRPIKHSPIMCEYRRVEAELTCAIYERFGIKSTVESQQAIDVVDQALPHDEIKALMADPAMFRVRKGLDTSIGALPPRHALHVFAQRFRELFPEAA